MADFPDLEQNPVYSSAIFVNGHEYEYISLPRIEDRCFKFSLELESIIRTDDKQAFVCFLKHERFYFGCVSYNDFETRLFKLLCYRRATGCASAWLNGETVLPKVDLNLVLLADPLEDEDEFGDNLTPLELSAKMLRYGLTKLFIEHGADPTESVFPYLPLNLALDSFCDHKIVKDFDAGESVYKLFSLFRLQELTEPLDTIKLLASTTKQQQVTALGVCCVEEWNLVKLTALLIHAWDKLVIDDNIYSSPIAKLIVLQLDRESDLEKKEVMRSMLHAFRLVEMSRYYVMENLTHSMIEVVANNLPAEVKLHDKGTHMVSADLNRFTAEPLRSNKEFLESALGEKREKRNSNAPSNQLLAGSRYPNQAGMNMSWTRGSSSTMTFTSAFHTLVPKISADLAPLASAKRLVDVSCRRHPAMRCMSIVAALTSGFRRM